MKYLALTAVLLLLFPLAALASAGKFTVIEPLPDDKFFKKHKEIPAVFDTSKGSGGSVLLPNPRDLPKPVDRPGYYAGGVYEPDNKKRDLIISHDAGIDFRFTLTTVDEKEHVYTLEINRNIQGNGAQCPLLENLTLPPEMPVSPHESFIEECGIAFTFLNLFNQGGASAYFGPPIFVKDVMLQGDMVRAVQAGNLEELFKESEETTKQRVEGPTGKVREIRLEDMEKIEPSFLIRFETETFEPSGRDRFMVITKEGKVAAVLSHDSEWQGHLIAYSPSSPSSPPLFASLTSDQKVQALISQGSLVPSEHSVSTVSRLVSVLEEILAEKGLASSQTAFARIREKLLQVPANAIVSVAGTDKFAYVTIFNGTRTELKAVVWPTDTKALSQVEPVSPCKGVSCGANQQCVVKNGKPFCEEVQQPPGEQPPDQQPGEANPPYARFCQKACPEPGSLAACAAQCVSEQDHEGVARVNERSVFNAYDVQPRIGQSGGTVADPQGYEWNLGDGTIKNGKFVGHAYSSMPTGLSQSGACNNSYEVTLSVTNDSGLKKSWSFCIAVREETPAPVKPTPVGPLQAAFTASQETDVPVGHTVRFDASSTQVPSGMEVTYTWIIDGETKAQGQTFEFAFEAPGEYNVVLNVVDISDSANASQVQKTITVTSDGQPTEPVEPVEPVEPTEPTEDTTLVAVIEMDRDQGSAPLTVAFDASASQPAGQIVEYQWGFGDGSTPQTLSTPKVTHTFQQARTDAYKVELVIRDGAGNTANQFAYVLVTSTDIELGISGPLAGLQACTSTTTGPSAHKKYGLDRVLFAWEYDDIASTTCLYEAGDNLGDSGFFCDGAQLPLFMVKRATGFDRAVRTALLNMSSDTKEALKVDEMESIEDLEILLHGFTPLKHANGNTAVFLRGKETPFIPIEPNDPEFCGRVNNEKWDGLVGEMDRREDPNFFTKYFTQGIDDIEEILARRALEEHIGGCYGRNLLEQYAGVLSFDLLSRMVVVIEDPTDELLEHFGVSNTTQLKDLLAARDEPVSLVPIIPEGTSLDTSGLQGTIYYTSTKDFERLFPDLKKAFGGTEFVQEKSHFIMAYAADDLKNPALKTKLLKLNPLYDESIREREVSLTDFQVLLTKEAYTPALKRAFMEAYGAQLSSDTTITAAAAELSDVTAWTFSQATVPPGHYAASLVAEVSMAQGMPAYSDIHVVLNPALPLENLGDKYTANPFFHLSFDSSLSSDARDFGAGTPDTASAQQVPFFTNGTPAYLPAVASSHTPFNIDVQTRFAPVIRQGTLFTATAPDDKGTPWQLSYSPSAPLRLALESDTRLPQKVFYGFLEGGVLYESPADYGFVGAEAGTADDSTGADSDFTTLEDIFGSPPAGLPKQFERLYWLLLVRATLVAADVSFGGDAITVPGQPSTGTIDVSNALRFAQASRLALEQLSPSLPVPSQSHAAQAVTSLDALEALSLDTSETTQGNLSAAHGHVSQAMDFVDAAIAAGGPDFQVEACAACQVSPEPKVIPAGTDEFLFNWFTDAPVRRKTDQFGVFEAEACTSGWKDPRLLARLEPFSNAARMYAMAFLPENTLFGLACATQDVYLNAQFLDGSYSFREHQAPAEEWFGGDNRALQAHYGDNTSFKPSLQAFLDGVKEETVCVKGFDVRGEPSNFTLFWNEGLFGRLAQEAEPQPLTCPGTPCLPGSTCNTATGQCIQDAKPQPDVCAKCRDPEGPEYCVEGVGCRLKPEQQPEDLCANVDCGDKTCFVEQGQAVCKEVDVDQPTPGPGTQPPATLEHACSPTVACPTGVCISGQCIPAKKEPKYKVRLSGGTDPFEAQKCTETDNGKDRSVFGEATGYNYAVEQAGIFPDRCDGRINQIERTCSFVNDPTGGKGHVVASHDSCGEGRVCQDGACVEGELPRGCTEEDGGNDAFFRSDIFVNPPVAGELPDAADWCRGDTLIEYYCSTNNQGREVIRHAEINCDNGCRGGRCLK